TSLSMVGYKVLTAADGIEALDIFHNEVPALVVLDVMLPKLDGYGVCQKLRKLSSNIPIIMLTALADVADRTMGLTLGADDYMAKPFSPKELEARIRSLLRRVKQTDTSGILPSGVFRVGPLRIDTKKRQVYKGDEQVRLTGTEFRLLELLVTHNGATISRSEILEKVWGYAPEHQADMHIVNVHISSLRANLEQDPSRPELIITSRGTGYLFQRIIQPRTNE
ncbi:MAG: winged helix-turn-helix domain-containing protein, partial [Nostocaceae cyanobacterium]|nr:winged helix-turn-helix domain-containing protein [Nostocaceae cyanobacterium]